MQATINGYCGYADRGTRFYFIKKQFDFHFVDLEGGQEIGHPHIYLGLDSILHVCIIKCKTLFGDWHQNNTLFGISITPIHYLGLASDKYTIWGLASDQNTILGISIRSIHYFWISITSIHYLGISIISIHYLGTSITSIYYLGISITLMHYLRGMCLYERHIMGSGQRTCTLIIIICPLPFLSFFHSTHVSGSALSL